MEVFRVKAFTNKEKIKDKNILGSPAIVCFCKNRLPTDGQMSKLAQSNTKSNTVFLYKKRAVSNHFDIRHFNSKGDQLYLCSNGIIATLPLLKKRKIEQAKYFFDAYALEKKNIRNFFNIKIKDGLIFFDLPKMAYQSFSDKDKIENLLEILNLQKEDIYDIVTIDILNDCFLELKNAELLRKVQPDFLKLKFWCYNTGIRNFGITAKSDLKDFDYQVRIFSPHKGKNENSICNSSNCGLGNYWSKKLEKKELKVLFPYQMDFNGDIGGVQHIVVDEYHIWLGGDVE